MYHFFYEVNYKISDAMEWISFTLPDFEKSVTLRNLKPRSNYTAVLSTANQCLRVHATPIHFATTDREVHPAITNVMSHEIFLIVLVLLLWVVIITHFLLMFMRVTMFSSLSTPGLHFSRENEEEKRKNSTDSANSVLTPKGSKSHNVLEDAVCMWRSETVLSKVELLDGMEARRLVSVDADRASLNSEGKEGDRRQSSSMLGLPMKEGQMIRSHSDGEGPLVSSNRSPLIHGREVSFYLPQRKKFSILESAHAMKQQMEEEQKRIEQQKRLARRRTFVFDRTGSKRKISEVLLGKATSDIRRCSSPGNFNNLDRGAIRKRFQKSRRRSLLQNLSLGRSFRAMRNKYRRRRMECVREDPHENSPSSLEGRKESVNVQLNPMAPQLPDASRRGGDKVESRGNVIINIDEMNK
ncbi:hypothetical protein L596_014251 [Steinernema carpocapsae]|uniref:Fibronectin type-III domain-containing protein n=1 Tax=Steinernema carpocapsae TaxID=34508 RepID=A0A4U5NBD4_STECR|nr:hypothetical protein L596_014251 [Steinernema carpocapsae]